jgi:hypothetical protein
VLGQRVTVNESTCVREKKPCSGLNEKIANKMNDRGRRKKK